VRYLERVPEPGERIRGLADEAFVVSHVEADDAGFVVTCVAPPTQRYGGLAPSTRSAQ
jgi:hypothetical protein